ncbi:MAG: 30S ribosomal protein S9 [Planctomycetota bacterium]
MIVVKKDKINGDALGTGRRKSSVARVRVRAGSGKITVNGRTFEEYFTEDQDRQWILDVLNACGKREGVDVLVRIAGGGSTGQSGAIRMGLARAMMSFNEEHFPALRDGGFLTRDARMKERKKCGLHGARRGVQFSKR